MQWDVLELNLPLKYEWKIAGASASSKKNFLIKYDQKIAEISYPTAIVKDIEEIKTQVKSFFEKYKNDSSFEEVHELLCELSIDFPVKAALESLFYVNKNISEKIPTFYSIPLMETTDAQKFYEKNNLQRFAYIKVKVTPEHRDLLKMVLEMDHKIALDANESFSNIHELETFFEGVNRSKIEFIEEPFKRSNKEDYKKLKGLGFPPIIADESLQERLPNSSDLEYYDGINIKLMKCGGIFRAQEQLKKARELGLKVLLGCMVESTLSLRVAFNLASEVDWVDLDSFLFLKEDPYQFILEENGRLLAMSDISSS